MSSPSAVRSPARKARMVWRSRSRRPAVAEIVHFRFRSAWGSTCAGTARHGGHGVCHASVRVAMAPATRGLNSAATARLIAAAGPAKDLVDEACAKQGDRRAQPELTVKRTADTTTCGPHRPPDRREPGDPLLVGATWWRRRWSRNLPGPRRHLRRHRNRRRLRLRVVSILTGSCPLPRRSSRSPPTRESWAGRSLTSGGPVSPSGSARFLRTGSSPHQPLRVTMQPSATGLSARITSCGSPTAQGPAMKGPTTPTRRGLEKTRTPLVGGRDERREWNASSVNQERGGELLR